jgi:hypothetical protein
MKKIKVILMTYGEFEKLVNDNLFEGKFIYEYVADEELSNDIEKLYMKVDGSIDEYGERDLNKCLNSNTQSGYALPVQYMSHVFINELCRRKVIEPANYLINISW